MDQNPEVMSEIGRNVPWAKLPVKVKEIFGNAENGYKKAVIAYSIRNQLRFSENLIKTIRKDEGKYYEEVVQYSKDHLMLYPYHLSDRIVKGLRITPTLYYISVMEMIMDQEKSYDSLPNFTAADCLRLLGIGRNQYIELMNKHRASRKLFRRKPPRELLPTKPVEITIEPWFIVQVGYVTEEDIALTKPSERKIIDFIIDNGGQRAGTLEYDSVHSLYRKGLIYVDVPIDNDDYIVVPPLEGFVMNRVLGDYFETLLYKIFVSIDEHTTILQLSTVLDIEAQLIKNAVSLYCRLGFAYIKGLKADMGVGTMDPSWKKYQTKCRNSYSYAQDESTIADELSSALVESKLVESDSFSSTFDLSMQALKSPDPNSSANSTNSADHSILSTGANTSLTNPTKRIAFLFDSTLTAFLMMGNLSPDLKIFGVTLFEVGKMPDESLDSFLSELENISWTEGEGEAQRYFEHAKTLRKTILFLRNNPNMRSMPLDLLRCESLLNLDSQTCSRLMSKNYELSISMAPLSYEVKPVCSENLPHFGPAIPQVNSIWFKLFLYSITNSGPTSLLLSRGAILSELPLDLTDCDKYLVTSWGHDPSVIPGANAIFTLNDALTHSAVFVQAYGMVRESSTVIIPFPLTTTTTTTTNKDKGDDETSPSKQMYAKWAKHPAIVKLTRLFDLERNCGFITMMNIRGSSNSDVSSSDTGIVRNADPKPATNILPKSTTLSNVVEEDQNMDLTELVMAENEEGDVIISGSVAPRSLAEPQNGFKDDQSAKIYQEALQEELDQELSALNLNVKPRGFDSRQQKIESLRLDLSDLSGLGDQSLSKSGKESKSSNIIPNNDTNNTTAQGEHGKDKFWFDDWTLLDCQFGLPLFDSGINEIVCQQLVSRGLWDEQSLEQLVKFNKDLGKQLKDFINTYQVPSTWNEETPLPSKNFYCQNGRLQEYEP